MSLGLGNIIRQQKKAAPAAAPTVTDANNGLSLSGTIVQLGGTLIKNTEIFTSDYYLMFKEALTYGTLPTNYFEFSGRGIYLNYYLDDGFTNRTEFLSGGGYLAVYTYITNFSNYVKLDMAQTSIDISINNTTGSGFIGLNSTSGNKSILCLRIATIPHGIVVSSSDSLIKIGKGTSVNDFDFKGIQVNTSKNIIFNNYPSTRNDASGIAKALYVINAAGDLGYGTITPAGIGAEVPLTFDNGLTRTVNNVQLGGTLVKVTTIDTTINYNLIITGDVPTATQDGTLRVLNASNTGRAISISAGGTGGVGVIVGVSSGTCFSGSATSGKCFLGSATTGTGLDITVTEGLPAQLSAFPASTNTVVEVLRLVRTSSGVAANGIGAAIHFRVEDSTAAGTKAVGVEAILTEVTAATKTSKAVFTGYNSGAEVNLMTMNGNGSWQITPITATAASAITAAEGMMLFVSNTNATFTSIGFWGYQNGAWAKM